MSIKMVKIIPRFFNPSKESFFLFGPRGTGKSTWLKKYYANALWIDMLDAKPFFCIAGKINC